MRKANHRSAYAADAAFMKRLEAQQSRRETINPNGQAGAAPAPPQRSKANERVQKVKQRNMESRFDSVVFDERTGSLTVTFTGATLLGLNMMLRMHDAQATGLKATWKKRVEALTYENKDLQNLWLKAASFPLIVEEVYVTAERITLDSESVCAACKPIIDSFVRCGWIPDDNTRYLAHPIPYTFRGANPGVVITFRPAPELFGLICISTMAAAHAITPLPG